MRFLVLALWLLGASLFIVPPIMVLYLEGPKLAAIEFAVIQTAIVAAGAYVFSGRLLR